MNGKKCRCFFWAGMGLILATGAPGDCQVSPGWILKSSGGGMEAARWVSGNSKPEEPPSVSPGLGSPQPPISYSPEREDRKIMEKMRQIEKNKIRYNEEAQGQEYFEFIPGKIPILISAPHGAKHYRTRKGCWKDEEAYTASLAISLGQATGAHVIYTRNKTWEDPNNDLNTRYKDAVRKVVNDYGIKFLIDLHGAGRDQPFKIDLGILSRKAKNSSCPTFKNIVEKNFTDYQKKIFNQKFSANDRCTITSFARNELKIEAVQVEINAVLRKAAGRTGHGTAGDAELRAQEKEFSDLIARMERMIREVNEKIGNGCPDESPS